MYGLKRVVLFAFSFLFILGVPGAAAQDADGPAHVYEAYYKVSYGDLEAWNRQYFEYGVPVLTAMRDEGIIEGWSQYQHQTGGEYNIRFTARTNDWGSLDTFWSEYLSRLQAATPASEWQTGNRMIQAHRDEIWDITTVQVPENLQQRYLYASSYQYGFGDGAEWSRIWREVAGPLMNEAMEQGILGGFVVLNHNTGGAHNFKILYLFEEWDHIDDFFAHVLGGMAEKNPADFQKLGGLIQAHDDIIWTPTTRSGM